MSPPPGAPRYDRIGRTYARTRRTDPRIAARIVAAIGDAHTVVNVGAGTGNYEPADRSVVAVEPSRIMIDQRPPEAAPVIEGVAERLPVATGAFDAAMALLTVHHWNDLEAGLRELERVAERQVIFLFDASISSTYWLFDDYFPEFRMLQSEQRAPTPGDIGRYLDVQRVEVILVPGDCIDGFGGSYWQRPEAHLDPTVRAGISWLAQLDPSIVERNAARLAAELTEGRWDAKYGHLRDRDSLDVGYRLVICGSPPPAASARRCPA